MTLANAGPVIISIPNLGNITPTPIDLPLPEMPAVEGDELSNGACGEANPC